MTTYRYIALAMLLIAASPRAEEAAPAPEPRYEVEIIVFDHLDQSRNTPEVAPLPLPAGEAGGPAPSRDPDERPPTEPRVTFYVMPPHPRSPEFQPLPAAATRFDRLYERLDRLDAYRPLVQLGWTQYALPRLDAEPYRIPVSLTDQAGVAGTVTLYKERYVHLKLDLTRGLPRDRRRAGAGADAQPARLVESRRIRGTEVQYFDNPAFGVIASIREIKPPPAAEATRAGAAVSRSADGPRRSGG